MRSLGIVATVTVTPVTPSPKFPWGGLVPSVGRHVVCHGQVLASD